MSYIFLDYTFYFRKEFRDKNKLPSHTPPHSTSLPKSHHPPHPLSEKPNFKPGPRERHIVNSHQGRQEMMRAIIVQATRAERVNRDFPEPHLNTP